MPTFRNANFIQLHDAGVNLHPAHIECEGDVGWCEFAGTIGHIVAIPGDELARLFRYLQLPFADNITLLRGGERVEERLGFDTFHIHTESTTIGHGGLVYPCAGSPHIRSLKARIAGTSLLVMRIAFEWLDDEGDLVMSRRNEVTYSGNFTVWWEADTEYGQELQDG